MTKKGNFSAACEAVPRKDSDTGTEICNSSFVRNFEMRNQAAGVAFVFAAFFCFSSVAFAQTKPPAKVAKAANPATSSRAIAFNPRDLSGVWMQDRPRPDTVLERYWIYELTQEEPPMTAWGAAQYAEAKSGYGTRSYPISETNDPIYKSCAPPGFPRAYFHAFPLQIVMAPGEVLMLFEWDSVRHQIFTDGRAHDATLGPLWMGDSIGHWEGNTLVADTVNFNDKTWLDRIGHPHSTQLHVIERIQRVDREHLQDDITIDDPKAYSRPWSGRIVFALKPTWTLAEEFCEDKSSFETIEKQEVSPAK
jgi:hypothetical protein